MSNWWWPFGRTRNAHDTGGAAAAAAARQGLEREKERATVVHQVSEELRQHRERNHFAQLLEQSMRPTQPGARHRRGRRA